MNTNIIAEKIEIINHPFYQYDFIKPFVDLYYKHSKMASKFQFKMFHSYFFRPELFMSAEIEMKIYKKEDIFLKNGKINFNNEDVKRKIKNRQEVFVGFRRIKSLCPFFICISEYEDGFYLNGFTTNTKDDIYTSSFIEIGDNVLKSKKQILKDRINDKDSIYQYLNKIIKK